MRLGTKILLLSACTLFHSLLFGAMETDDLHVELEEGRLRKEPGFFSKPAKDDPRSQLVYADGLNKAGKLRKAAKAYKELVHAWHESQEASRAQMAYAEVLLKRGQLTKAFDEFQYMVDFFAGQFDYDIVLDRQFKIANEVMTRRHWKFFIFRGFEAPERALPLLEKIVVNGPEWQKASQAQFNIGLIHEQSSDLEDAVAAYELLVNRYSESDYAAGAAFRRAHCLYKLSGRYPRDETLCRRALTATAGFLRDYTGDPNEEAALAYRVELKDRVAKLCYDIAVFYDKKAQKRNAAIIAYTDFIKRFPSSKLAVEASRRKDELEKEEENRKSAE